MALSESPDTLNSIKEFRLKVTSIAALGTQLLHHDVSGPSEVVDSAAFQFRNPPFKNASKGVISQMSRHLEQGRVGLPRSLTPRCWCLLRLGRRSYNRKFRSSVRGSGGLCHAFLLQALRLSICKHGERVLSLKGVQSTGMRISGM